MQMSQKQPILMRLHGLSMDIYSFVVFYSLTEALSFKDDFYLFTRVLVVSKIKLFYKVTKGYILC